MPDYPGRQEYKINGDMLDIYSRGGAENAE